MGGMISGVSSRFYSAAKTAAMMAKAKQTLADQQAERIAAQVRRDTDPFERAKLALQRARVVCFSHSLHVPGSTLIVVGTRTMTRDEMMIYAERHGRW